MALMMPLPPQEFRQFAACASACACGEVYDYEEEEEEEEEEKEEEDMLPPQEFSQFASLLWGIGRAHQGHLIRVPLQGGSRRVHLPS